MKAGKFAPFRKAAVQKPAHRHRRHALLFCHGKNGTAPADVDFQGCPAVSPHQPQAILLHAPRNLCRFRLAFHQIPQKILPQDVQIFGKALPQSRFAPQSFNLLIQTGTQLFQYLRQLPCVDRLQDIFRYIQPYCLFRILKIIIAGKYHQPYGGAAPVQFRRKLQPVHIRHTDISQHNVRLQQFNFFQRVPAVFRVADYRKTRFFPVYFSDNACPHFFLIIYQQYFIVLFHTSSPAC